MTEDMAASLPGLVTDTGRAFAVEEPFPIHVQQVINGGKVTDHHALLPTKSMANADLAALPAGEWNVLRLIAARLLCAVGEPHRYAETTLTTICAGEEFSAKGKEWFWPKDGKRWSGKCWANCWASRKNRLSARPMSQENASAASPVPN